jgi:hypothetical protein
VIERYKGRAIEGAIDPRTRWRPAGEPDTVPVDDGQLDLALQD